MALEMLFGIIAPRGSVKQISLLFGINSEFSEIKSINKIGGKIMSCEAQNNATGGAIYGLGLIGAAVYYIQAATGFWMGVVGFLKALVWPAFLVYEALKQLAL